MTSIEKDPRSTKSPKNKYLKWGGVMSEGVTGEVGECTCFCSESLLVRVF